MVSSSHSFHHSAVKLPPPVKQISYIKGLIPLYISVHGGISDKQEKATSCLEVIPVVYVLYK